MHKKVIQGLCSCIVMIPISQKQFCLNTGCPCTSGGGDRSYYGQEGVEDWRRGQQVRWTYAIALEILGCFRSGCFFTTLPRVSFAISRGIAERPLQLGPHTCLDV
ncbi:hypothetical protein F0562_004947 [Nyssa sinensis]|uniref:Uncharacterized protein n=1 Tax=Nyssa sinensis TaxID=561372 RepID=A0A5J5AJ85_9ASTE|nr:hypothetical protein F0562_004947 [Nyssa sinensis]